MSDKIQGVMLHINYAYAVGFVSSFVFFGRENGHPPSPSTGISTRWRCLFHDRIDFVCPSAAATESLSESHFSKYEVLSAQTEKSQSACLPVIMPRLEFFELHECDSRFTRCLITHISDSLSRDKFYQIQPI